MTGELVQEGLCGSSVDRTYGHGGLVDEWSSWGKDDIAGKPEGRVSGRRTRQIVASQADGLWYNHHYDAGGNCIMLTAGALPGAIQEQYDYDAFGFPYFYTPTGGKFTSIPRTRFLFTGREWLSDLRIYDYRARQYQPEMGRFLQPDPKEFGAGDYNLYRYCHNDPVNKTDPFGLLDTETMIQRMFFETGTTLLGAGIGALIGGGGGGALGLAGGPAAPGTVPAGAVGGAMGGIAIGGGIGLGIGKALSPIIFKEGGDGDTPEPKPGEAGGDGASKDFSKSVKDSARAESKETCVFCKDATARGPGPKQSNIDHAIPKSRGGNNTLQNAQNTCRTCNLEKATKTTKEYLEKKNQ